MPRQERYRGLRRVNPSDALLFVRCNRWPVLGRLTGGRDGNGLDWDPRPQLAGALDDDAFARLQPLLDDPVVADAVIRDDLPHIDFVLRTDDIHRFQTLQLLYGLLRDTDCIRVLELRHDHTHE